MVSAWMMKALLGAYLVVAATCVWEGRYAQAVYWIGAATITVSLLLMK